MGVAGARQWNRNLCANSRFEGVSEMKSIEKIYNGFEKVLVDAEGWVRGSSS